MRQRRCFVAEARERVVARTVSAAQALLTTPEPRTRPVEPRCAHSRGRRAVARARQHPGSRGPLHRGRARGRPELWCARRSEVACASSRRGCCSVGTGGCVYASEGADDGADGSADGGRSRWRRARHATARARNRDRGPYHCSAMDPAGWRPRGVISPHRLPVDGNRASPPAPVRLRRTSLLPFVSRSRPGIFMIPETPRYAGRALPRVGLPARSGRHEGGPCWTALVAPERRLLAHGDSCGCSRTWPCARNDARRVAHDGQRHGTCEAVRQPILEAVRSDRSLGARDRRVAIKSGAPGVRGRRTAQPVRRGIPFARSTRERVLAYSESTSIARLQPADLRRRARHANYDATGVEAIDLRQSVRRPPGELARGGMLGTG